MKKGVKQRIILSLGSNYDQKKNMEKAKQLLSALFPNMFFSVSISTKPIAWMNDRLFLNCLARVETEMDKQSVIALLKTIERNCGRTPEMKASGVVPMDIDLLQWNEEILKPTDMQREYVQSLLKTLFIHHEK